MSTAEQPTRDDTLNQHLHHPDLGSAVGASLRVAIISGQIPAGDRLVETELADRFGVSRGPIRDALAELERGGLVELRARKGSYVRSLTAIDVDEVYTLRISLESLAVRRSIEFGADHRPLRALLDELESANQAGDAMLIGAADMALHRGFVEAANHGRLLDAWERLADQTLLMMTSLPTLDPEIQGPTGGHRTIVERMAAAEADAAVAALVDHLRAARLAMLGRLTE
ncbi:MAG: GntR family transcriptional regulator [Acidimicrobiales bacterium]